MIISDLVRAPTPVQQAYDVEKGNVRVALEVDQPNRTTYWLEADWAIRSTYL